MKLVFAASVLHIYLPVMSYAHFRSAFISQADIFHTKLPAKICIWGFPYMISAPKGVKEGRKLARNCSDFPGERVKNITQFCWRLLWKPLSSIQCTTWWSQGIWNGAWGLLLIALGRYTPFWVVTLKYDSSPTGDFRFDNQNAKCHQLCPFLLFVNGRRI